MFMEANSGGQQKMVNAVKTIERCWCSYRNKQIFKLLKYAICAAEHSLTKEVMRKLSPCEAAILNDPTCNSKIRFRFGGSEFPPLILFKVFIKCGENGVKYYSGKKMIQPASKAAEDSCRLMGSRQFYDQIIVDACQHHQDKITDVLDINTMKDVMQYLSYLDECPPEKGGRSNLWRQLTLEDVPRHNIVHDVITYINSGKVSERLFSHLMTQRDKVETFFNIINDSPGGRRHTRQPCLNSSKSTGRRSQGAKKRVEKMKKNYVYGYEKNCPLCEDHERDSITNNENFLQNTEDSDWEDEADELYEWSQDLTLDDLGLTSPLCT